MKVFETYKDGTVASDKREMLCNVPISNSAVYCGAIRNIIKEKDQDHQDIPSMAATVVGLKNTAAVLSTSSKFSDGWTDIDAQESYLNSKPTCYLILGKPGAGAYSLGEAMSKKLNCIHICPKNVISDEIEQNGATGNCMAFNLRQQNIIKYDVILKIIKSKLESPSVKHRGYVLSGLPLINTQRKPYCLSSMLYSEEGVLVNVDLIEDLLENLKKRKSRKTESSADSQHTSMSEEILDEEELEEEQEPEILPEEEEEMIVALPKFILELCSDIIFSRKPKILAKQSIFLEQVNNILVSPIAPDIVIYLTCPDKDLVVKKSHKYYNYRNNVYTFDTFTKNVETELRWPEKCIMSDYTSPFESNLFNPKYCCRHPINFTQQSKEQLCNYNNYVLPFVEQKFKDFEPTHIIKLDARTSVHQMMSHVNEKLMLLSIKPILIPEPLYLEEPPDEIDEFWRLVDDLNVIRCGNVNFNRFPSLWFNRCPVELKKRRSLIGISKLAVTFFKHVYLLSSLENMIAFCRNPRPYLNLKYLEPTCRVIVMGTKLSGKTMISNCLSWIFDAPIINYEEFVKDQREKKYNTFAKAILSEISGIIEDNRLLKWENKETERIIKLGIWDKSNFNMFETYVNLFFDILKYSNREIITEKDEEEILEPQELSPQLLDNYNHLKNCLSFLPFLEDIDQCMNVVEAKTLLQYAPQELTTTTEKPGTPILGDEDVTLAIMHYISSNDLQKEIQPTNEELMNEMVKVLLDNDKESLQNFKTYSQFIIDGLPPDPELWGYLMDAKLLPDHTIALIENREIEPELIQYYLNIAKCHKNYQERIVLTTDPLVKTKLLTKVFTGEDVRNIVEQLLNSILDTIFVKTTIVENKSEFAAFSGDIKKFREDWDSLKLKLEESFKLFIEIGLENKTDIEVIDEVLLNMRKNYCITPEVSENEVAEFSDDAHESHEDILINNDPRNLCETNIYCPIAFYNYGVLWKGKLEFCIKHNNKLQYFCKEECSELFRKDITRYQEYNKPFKTFPPLRICMIGCLGSGKSTVSKIISKELGLVHIDFGEIINTLLMPRHFKKVGRQYENSFTDTPIDDEGVMEFHTDEENENTLSDILDNETELRRIIYNYFERGAPILSVLMQKLIKKIWFEKPFVDTGFILDGFPRLPSDVEEMITCFCIPDLIIELEGSCESMLQRLSQKMHETWRTQLKEAKYKAKVKHDMEMIEWTNFITKNVVAKLICEEILDNIDTSGEEPPMKVLSAASVIMDAHPQGSSNVDANLFTYYNQMILDYPAPTDSREWEDSDAARERIDTRLESVYEVEYEEIQSLKDILLEHNIRTLSVDGTKRLDKVLRNILFKLKKLRNRSMSFFEQTFVIDCNIAEMLLLEGFFFFSKFHRMCPVYIYENCNTIMNPFKIMKRKQKVFPVIHRAYIYFLFGEESVKKFRNDPLKYVSSRVIDKFKEYPLTISVIGPPKSGKTTLASKLAKRYGLIYISRGTAVRYVLEHMYWTELGSRMKDALCKGECINYKLIMQAIKTVAIDHRTITYGFIFDGFPEFSAEAVELMNAGLYPNIVFDIFNDKDLIIKHALEEIYYDVLKRNPPYSASHIECKYANWLNKHYQIRNWIQQDVQNLSVINGKNSRWQCLQDAIRYIKETFSKNIHYYLNNVSEKIVPTIGMCITNKAINERQSPFKNLCPLCLKNNILRNSCQPVDKKGVVHFKNKFYWVCPSHMDAVLKNPERHLLLKNEIEIPEIPVVVKTVNVAFVYENGICIVTYAQNLPNQRVAMGSHKYAASYKGKTYLFCNAKCLDMFLATPHLYCDITVLQSTKMFPPLSVKKLPNIGYLEQTVGNIITDACCSVNLLRPKYPGLDLKLSGLLYIALYLKTHNPNGTNTFFPLYDKASKVYDARCKLIVDVGLRMRSMDNPFANYPKCCNKIRSIGSGTVRKPSSITENFSTRRVPVPDERYEYLCTFHKPASKVPAFLNVVDIAGLVRGAAEGQGLGNAFLSHIKACDAIFNLCRAFDDEDVIHVDGEVNPVRDLETIGEELRLKDEDQLLKDLDKLDRAVNRGGDKKLKPEYDTLVKIKAILVDEKKHIRFGDWSAADIEVLNRYLFLTSKPALYLVNLSEKDYIRKKNKWLPKLKEWIDKNDPGAPLIPFSGVFETKLLDMEPPERQAYLKENNLTSALDKIIVQGYKALQLEYFFTAGPDEVKAWTIQKGTKAPQAAGRIHTDFEKGFIMAEVMHFKDFREEGTEAACKAAGKYRQQGRNYVVEDGDIIFFKFNAGAGLKDAKKK